MIIIQAIPTPRQIQHQTPVHRDILRVKEIDLIAKSIGTGQNYETGKMMNVYKYRYIK